MDTQRWQQIEEIFQSALDLAPAMRDGFIAEQCGDNSDLKREVEKLLADYNSAESFIESPVWTKNQLLDSSAISDFGNSLDEQLNEHPPDPMLGRQIGAYRLEKEIGRGGMGAVYYATRADGSFRQQVAVKLIKRGMDTDFILRRFRQERQILAQLNHPFIAQLLDGGTTDDDLPYFVMEFIEGEPLYRFCDRKKLTINGRLKLFRQICQALDFAHQNQIIHRDIKPPNILVGKGGTPKLLDFGIAKVLNPEFGIDTIDPTLTAMRLMTPEYASPEQVCGGSITPASDIYSLGVLLYELLTGHRPYRFKNRAAHEIARVICEEEPDRPSTGITRPDNLLPTGASEAATLIDLCRFRGAEKIEDLQREIAGDIERIILKCLRKEPDERYQTAAELEQDITRYLEGKPVAAESFAAAAIKSPTPTDELSKSLAVLPLKVLSHSPSAETGEEFLSVGLADALVTRLSGVQRLVVRPTSSVLRFGAGDAFAAGRELGVDFVVDGNIRRVGKRIRVTAQLLNVKNNSTLWSESFDEQLTDFLALEDSISGRVAESLIPKLTGEERERLEKRGTNNPQAYEAYIRGRYFYNKFTNEDLPKAVASFREAIRLDPNYALPHVGIADFFAWSAIFGEIPSSEAFPQAAAAARRALEIDPGLGEAYAILAFAIFLYDWDRDEGFRLVRKAIELAPNYGFAHECHSNFLVASGQFDEAVSEVRRAEELDPLSPRSMLMTAWTLYQTGRFDEAVAKARRANEMEKDFPQGLLHLGNTLTAAGEAEESVRVLEESYRLWGGSGLPGYMLCHALVAAGREEDARKILDELHESAAVRHVKTYFLGMAHAALGELDEAFEWFERAVEKHSEWMIWFGTDVKLAALRGDSRYEDLLRRTKSPLAEARQHDIKKVSVTGGEKTIAVLPLKFIGTPTGTGDDEYLSIGLADALVTRLANVRRLVVRPTSSVLPFNNADANPFQAGRELKVDYIVDGNIRRVGERIRVTVQLLNVAENSSRWAEKFSEHCTDVLELEDSISERVVKSLIPQLTGEEERKLSKRGTESPAAYEAYLRGRYFWNHFTPETFPKALEWFEKAIALDENYALAHAGVADFYIWATIFGMYPPPEGCRKTRAAATRALELDDQLSEAHAALGFLSAFSDFDWTAGERLFKRALELNPHNALAHEWYSAMLAGVGRSAESGREILRAHELDPLSLRETTLTAWTLYQLRRFPEALAKSEEIIEMNPLYYQGFFQRGNVLCEMNRAAEAVADLRKAIEIAPGAGYLYYKLCFALVAVGERDEARRVLRDFEKLLQSSPQSAYHMAMCYAALDERDRAFEWFDKALKNRDMWVVWLATEPKLDKLRGDERFNELLRKTNRPHLVRRIAKTRKVSKTEVKTFAVLPFRFNSLTTGDDTDEKFLGVGLADALITRLSKTDSLIVRPTSSVLHLDETADAFSAGRKLAADFVLDGNIRRAGERIRVSAQLLDVNENSTAWAETFDEKFTDILEVEDSIAGRVAESLLPQLAGDEQRRISKRGTDDPAAYEAYLRGRFHWNQFTPESLSKALESFQKAIALDENYALAHVGVADFYTWANIYGLIPSASALDEAERRARRAIEIDERLGEAYATLGLVTQNRQRWAEAEKLKRQAIKLNPNYVHAHEWWAAQLIGLGRTDEGIEEMKRAESLDPLSLRVKTLTAWTLYQAHQFEDALARAKQIIELDKNYPQGYSQAGFALWALGRHAEALQHFQQFNEMIPNFALAKYQLCFGLAAVNRHDEARRVLEEIEALAASGYVKPFFLAMAHVAVGDTDAAFRYVEQSFAENEPWLLWFGTDPMLDVLRGGGDARYFDLLRRMNNPLGERQFNEAKKADTGSEKSIAVLPLKILGANTLDDDDYLSVGLADALITRLSNVRRFIVRPTSSVLQFGAESADSFAAGRKLGVNYVVDGNIRRVGERIRVTVQLLSIGENSSRWAAKFDEHFTDVLTLEDSISERVAKSLLPQLTGEEEKQLSKRGTNRADAYDAYLRGRFNWNLHTEESYAKAIGFYNRAIELDPDYALAYAAIAEYYIFLGIHCVIPFADGSKAAFDAAETAIRLDPMLAEGHAVRGFVAISYDFDWETAEKYLLRAIALNPNSPAAHSWYNSVLLHSGRFEEAMSEIDRVLELDPDSLLGLHFRAWAFYHSRRFEESIEVHRRILQTEPSYAWGLQTYSWALRRVGQFDEAVAQARRAVEITGENPFYLMALAAAYAEAGSRAEAETILDRLVEISKTRFVSEYMLAQVYCALNDREKAFENLEKAVTARDGWIVWIGVEPQFDLLRDDARFDALIRRINHPFAARQTANEATKPNAESRKKSKEKSIAVLPLKLLGTTGGGDTGDDDFLSVGLADALITRLSNVRRFVVRPTSSVLPYGKKEFDSFAAGRELGVDYVVDGSIQRSGIRIRVTAQLLNVRENAAQWAQTYDENFVDVLTLEDSISEQIAKSLLPHLSGEEKRQIKKRGTDNVEAFEAYLRGRHYWNTFTEEGFAKSLIYYNQAISIAPDYALAYAGIADYHNWLGIYAVLPFAETSAAAKDAAQRGVALDENLPEAHSALGCAAHLHDFDWQSAEISHRRALELNPNYAVGRLWYCHFLTVAGRFEEALREVEEARRLDPFTPIIQHTFSWAHFYARRFDESIQAARKLIADEPTYGMGYVLLCLSLLQSGKYAEAIDAGKRCVELLGRTPYTLVWLASAYAASGDAPEAKQLLAEIERLSARRYASPYLLAMVYCNLRETERSLELLETAWEIRDVRLLWLGVDPQFDTLRGEPRFEKILRRTNNPQIINR